MRVLAGEVADQDLAVDQVRHEGRGFRATGLRHGHAGVLDLGRGNALQAHMDAADDQRVAVDRTGAPDQTLGRGQG